MLFVGYNDYNECLHSCTFMYGNNQFSFQMPCKWEKKQVANFLYWNFKNKRFFFVHVVVYSCNVFQQCIQRRLSVYVYQILPYRNILPVPVSLTVFTGNVGHNISMSVSYFFGLIKIRYVQRSNCIIKSPNDCHFLTGFANEMHFYPFM